ncbi:Chemotaxis protein CheY [uncultured archaeon]|nr:Chemotaxis protein CheY [uncultured archaeon]
MDDEKSTVDTLRMALELENYDVVEAHNGEKAIRKAQSESLDLILLDIMLPDITGYEICNKLRKNPLTRSVPIIMLTGMTGTSNKMAGLDLGATDFISKPFDLSELKAKIRTVLQRPTP